MNLKKKFSEIVGAENFSDDNVQLKLYSTDYSYTPAGMPNYIVKPAGSDEVSAVVRICNENNVPVVPCSSKVHFYGAYGKMRIGHAEIAGAVTKVPLFWRAIAKAECKEEFWDIWGNESEESIANFFIVRVLLIGYTSQEQMEYDEKVLMDIMEEVGGIARRTKPSDESWIKNADSAGMWLMCGGYVSVDYVIETLSQCTEHGESYAQVKKNFTPPLMPDYGDPGWFQSFEMGHQGYSEFLVYWDPDDNCDGVDQFYLETSKMNIRERYYTSLLGPHQPLFLTGPKYGPNYHTFMLKVKDEFDPKWMSHPPVPLAHDIYVQKAPWMQHMVDWETPKPEDLHDE